MALWLIRSRHDSSIANILAGPTKAETDLAAALNFMRRRARRSQGASRKVREVFDHLQFDEVLSRPRGDWIDARRRLPPIDLRWSGGELLTPTELASFLAAHGFDAASINRASIPASQSQQTRRHPGVTSPSTSRYYHDFEHCACALIPKIWSSAQIDVASRDLDWVFRLIPTLLSAATGTGSRSRAIRVITIAPERISRVSSRDTDRHRQQVGLLARLGAEVHYDEGRFSESCLGFLFRSFLDAGGADAPLVAFSRHH